jgi:hypothetical protein
MTYEIIEANTTDETLNTKVRFNLDGVEVICDIFHFMPRNKADIELGIYNRSISEQQKLSAFNLNSTLILELELGKTKSIG